MKIKVFILSAITVLMLISCSEPEYIIEHKQVAYTVVEKELHTELDWATEFMFDIKTTKVVYNLVLQRNGYTKVESVSQNIFYSYKVGDTYYSYEYVTVKNPKYKEI